MEERGKGLSIGHETTAGAAQSPDAPRQERMIGNDPRIVEINALISRLAPTDLTVLVTGETGTGKDIVARLLHRLSPRRSKPFIKVNCPSIPESLLEGELFGYERGAFTGANTAKPGRFELANEGTLFLDEISEASLNVQGKLLQALAGEPLMRFGGTVPIATNARLIVATNVSLDEGVVKGRLRKDLVLRLSEVVIHIPPLRERPGDIPLLVEHYCRDVSRLMRMEYRPVEAGLMAQLLAQEWPGNVRELAARVKRFVMLGSEEELLASVPRGSPGDPRPGLGNESGGAAMASQGAPEKKFLPLKEVSHRAAEEAERALIEEALRHTLWNRREAAKLLQTSYSSLLRRIEAYGIGKP